MLERWTPALRLACLALAALLVYQGSRLAGRHRSAADSNFADSLLTDRSSAPDVPTNSVGSTESSGSNAVVVAASSVPTPPSARPPAASPLPPDVQTRIDRITQSEILGPVVRPLPMALLGIAGREAILRAPDGQTGLLREGDELGGIKLIQIGTNRVLIEHERQRKELMLFSGFGSEPLLGKDNKDSK